MHRSAGLFHPALALALSLSLVFACNGDDGAGTETQTGTTTTTTTTATTTTTTDGTTTTDATTTGDSVGETTTTGASTTTSTSSTTDPVCPPGSEGCECQDGACDPGLLCSRGLCVLPPPGCGDGVVQAPEECDDGGESPTCDADCTLAACGDGQVNQGAGEVCDDQGESPTCDADCTLAACGDGQVNQSAGEVCDDQGESPACNADCTPALCGDGQVNQAAGEVCDGEAPDNALCEGCDLSCEAAYGDCNADWLDGCELPLLNDPANCGECGKSCGGKPCTMGKCVDVADAFASYESAGRTVYIFKSSKCANLDLHVEFCQNKGLAWWKAKSQADAQQLITFAYNLDNWHTWIQVHGAATVMNPPTVDGYSVTVDGAGCVDSSPGGWTAFRKWACSFCEPANQQNESCCWDKDHAYDWFVCEL